MKDIVIIGAGGFAREVVWLIEENNKRNPEWNILGFISESKDSSLLTYPILGNDEWLLNCNREINAVCCVGNADLREKIISKYKDSKINFPTIISNNAIVSSQTKIGNGVIICAGTIITVNVEIDDFCIINLDCTIGHEAKLGSFVTMYPSVNVSGNVNVGRNTELGTGSSVIHGMNIGEHVILGASAAVVRDIPSWTTAVGVPAKVIKNRK